MPSKPVFLGARLASLPMRAQERSVSSEDGMDCVLAEFDDDTGARSSFLLIGHGRTFKQSVLFLCTVHYMRKICVRFSLYRE